MHALYRAFRATHAHSKMQLGKVFKVNRFDDLMFLAVSRCALSTACIPTKPSEGPQEAEQRKYTT